MKGIRTIIMLSCLRKRGLEGSWEHNHDSNKHINEVNIPLTRSNLVALVLLEDTSLANIP